MKKKSFDRIMCLRSLFFFYLWEDRKNIWTGTFLCYFYFFCFFKKFLFEKVLAGELFIYLFIYFRRFFLFVVNIHQKLFGQKCISVFVRLEKQKNLPKPFHLFSQIIKRNSKNWNGKTFFFICQTFFSCLFHGWKQL